MPISSSNMQRSITVFISYVRIGVWRRKQHSDYLHRGGRQYPSIHSKLKRSIPAFISHCYIRTMFKQHFHHLRMPIENSRPQGCGSGFIYSINIQSS